MAISKLLIVFLLKLKPMKLLALLGKMDQVRPLWWISFQDIKNQHQDRLCSRRAIWNQNHPLGIVHKRTIFLDCWLLMNYSIYSTHFVPPNLMSEKERNIKENSFKKWDSFIILIVDIRICLLGQNGSLHFFCLWSMNLTLYC